MSTNSYNTEYFTDKVKVYWELGKFQDAESLLNSLIDQHGESADLSKLLGLTFHKQSKFSESLVELNKAQKGNKEDIATVLNIVITLCDLSCYHHAQDIYTTLLESLNAQGVDGQELNKPQLYSLASSHNALGDQYKALNQMNAAAREYKKAIDLYSGSTKFRLNLAKLYIDSQRLDAGKQELEQLIDMDSECSEAHLLLGLLYYRQNVRHLAKSHWEKSFKLDPNDAAAHAYKTISANWSSEAPAQN